MNGGKGEYNHFHLPATSQAVELCGRLDLAQQHERLPGHYLIATHNSSTINLYADGSFQATRNIPYNSTLPASTESAADISTAQARAIVRWADRRSPRL